VFAVLLAMSLKITRRLQLMFEMRHVCKQTVLGMKKAVRAIGNPCLSVCVFRVYFFPVSNFFIVNSSKLQIRST
jgi:hypothetical protein